MRSKVYVRIGKHHVNNCEDSAGSYQIGSQRQLIVVCDGCSMGEKSHYASELIQKIVREIAKEEHYREYGANRQFELINLLEKVTYELFSRIKQVYDITGRNKYDYLSTILIAIADNFKKEFIYLVSGDGVICVDEKIEVFDQNNQPDYIGYYLEDDFNDWYKEKTIIKHGKLRKSICVATDGILTFSDSTDQFIQDEELNKIIRSLMIYSESSNEKEIQNNV